MTCAGVVLHENGMMNDRGGHVRIMRERIRAVNEAWFGAPSPTRNARRMQSVSSIKCIRLSRNQRFFESDLSKKPVDHY